MRRTLDRRGLRASVSKRFAFEAAHHLTLVAEEHKCRRHHGHSYVFEVVVRGDVQPNGMVIDYADIAAAVEPIVATLDHQDLNQLFDFETTAENLAHWLLLEVQDALGFTNVGIRFFETATTCVEVYYL